MIIMIYFQWPFCSAKRNNFGNFDSWHYRKHICEIILNLNEYLRRRCHLKALSSFSSRSKLEQRVEHLFEMILNSGVQF